MSVFDPRMAGQWAEDLPPEVFRSIIQAFEADLARLAQDIAAAAEAGDVPGCERAAHSLAGAAGAVGALGLERAARVAMGGCPPAALASLVPELLAEAQGALEALRGIRR